MCKINFSVDVIDLLGVKARTVVPTAASSKHMIEVDAEAIIQKGEDVLAEVVNATGVPSSLIVAAGDDHAYEGDCLPEFNLHFLNGKWYMRMGVILQYAVIAYSILAVVYAIMD